MKARFLVPLLAVIVFAALAVGCGKQIDDAAPGALVMDTAEHDRWEIALVNMRIEKNEEFSVPENSPLPAARIAAFEGLEYYFPQPALRFKTPFVAEEAGGTISLTKRGGQVVQYIRKGKVNFSHGGKTHTLTVFGPTDTSSGDYLWLPFFDATSGKETYPGGRYLDIEVDAEGMVDLDFNFAYNPLCDYNPDKYNCTMPPAENTLDFVVDAGEKTLNPGH